MRDIEFPTAWATAAVIDSEGFTAEDGRATIFGVCLDDGSNLWAFIHDGGHMFMRSNGPGMEPMAQEIQTHGDPPPGPVAQVWKYVLATDLKSALAVDAEMRSQ